MKTLKIAKGDPHNYPTEQSTELRSRVGHSAIPHPLIHPILCQGIELQGPTKLGVRM